MATRNATTKKPLRAVVGAAHHALRAYVKAYDLRSEGKVQHRYSIPLDGLTASVLDADGQVVECRPIEEWAAIGPQIRRALIALKSFQERLIGVLSDGENRVHVRYYLNILEGRANIATDGKALSKDDMWGYASGLALGDSTSKVLAQMQGPELDTVEGWAAIGKHVEVDFFQTLQSAERYGLTEAAREQREHGYRLSIIRRPKG